MPKFASYKDDPTRIAREKRRVMSGLIRSGATPSIFEKGTHQLVPEIRAMIDLAIAQRSIKSEDKDV